MIDARLQRLLVVFAAVLAAGCGSDEPIERPAQELEVMPDRNAAESEAAWRTLPSGWTRLRPPPFVRARAASVWTGEELFYWGGDTGFGGTHHADGAAFAPASGRWGLLPDSPLSARSSPGAVWTGREVILWGGQGDGTKSDGAAFDPETNSWRLLAEAPLAPRIPVAAVWTGKEMLVWGNVLRGAASVDGAAYDPEEDRWRELPHAPFALNEANAVWTGKEMVVYGALLDGNNHSQTEYAQGIAYDPEANEWRVLAPDGLSPQASSAAWTGDYLLVWDYLLAAGAYDAGRDAWRPVPDLPLRSMECYPQSALAAELVLAWYCEQGALYQSASRKWTPVAAPPADVYGRPVSAGSIVLFPGAAHEGHANALWAYKPKSSGRRAAARGTPRRPFTPRIERRGRHALMPVTFPDATSAVLSYSAELELAEMGVQPDVSFLYRADRPPRFPLTFYHGDPPVSLFAGERTLATYRVGTGGFAALWRARTGQGARVEEPPFEGTRYWLVFRFGSWTVLAPARDVDEARTLARSLAGDETDDGFVVLEASGPIALSDESGEGGGPALTIGDSEPAPARVRVDPRFRHIELSVEYGGVCRGRRDEVTGSGKVWYGSLCLDDDGRGATLHATVYGDRDFVTAVVENLDARQVRPFR